jgi:hypothetical protein
MRFELMDFKAKFSIQCGPEETGRSLTFNTDEGFASSTIDQSLNRAVQFEFGGILGLDFMDDAIQSVTIDYPSEVLEVVIVTPPPFTAPSGYSWVTRDNRYLLFSDSKAGEPSRLVAATDETRLPPAPPRDGWQWVWLGAQWMALPVDMDLSFPTDAPPSRIPQPTRPPGYKAFYWSHGDLKFYQPDGVTQEDMTRMAVEPPQWLLVPESAEVAADGTVTLRPKPAPAATIAATVDGPFKLPNGYHWSTEQARLMARNVPSGNMPERIVAATDSTRLPPQEAPKDCCWAWLVDHWLLLPVGAKISTSPPPWFGASPPTPPSGFRRYFLASGGITFTFPNTKMPQDIPILLGDLKTDGWLFVPWTSEEGKDRTITVR